jgi:hypothetical protein
MDDHMIDLADDFDTKLRDTSLIATREECLDIVTQLDHAIASIQRQIDVFNIKNDGLVLHPDQEDWLQNAAYACAMKKNQRHKVMMRDREFRNVKFQQHNDPALKLAKQEKHIAKNERMKAEAEARKAAKLVEQQKWQVAQAEISYQKSVARHFVNVARERLGDDVFTDIMNTARQQTEQGSTTT